jgi:hypothetical protein
MQGDKLSSVVHQVVNRSKNLTHVSVDKSSLWGADVREIKTGRRHVVNTEEHECTYLEWQHTWKPCEHVILFLSSNTKDKYSPVFS